MAMLRAIARAWPLLALLLSNLPAHAAGQHGFALIAGNDQF